MKKRLFPLLAALLCMVMLMGCTTHAGPESNKLTEAELQELQELFAPGSWYAQACTSYYEAAEAVDLGRLFYDGIGYAGLVYGQCYVTDRERDWVLEQEPAAENYGIFRAPRAAMDDILRQYFDISLDDTRKMGLVPDWQPAYPPGSPSPTGRYTANRPVRSNGRSSGNIR